MSIVATLPLRNVHREPEADCDIYECDDSDIYPFYTAQKSWGRYSLLKIKMHEKS